MLESLFAMYIAGGGLLFLVGIISYVFSRASGLADETKLSAQLAVFAWVWPVLLAIALLAFLPDIIKLPYDIVKDAFRKD